MQAVSEQQSDLASGKGTVLAQQLGVNTTLTRGLLEARKYRTPKAAGEAAAIARLEELIRLQAGNSKALSQALHLQSFADVRFVIRICMM